MRAIIVADGDVSTPQDLGPILAEHDQRDGSLVIAADGGALKAIALGLRPHVVVGDADSLPAERIAELRDSGVEVIVHPAQKDESDTELAVREALSRGADSIVLIGGFGGNRVEHSIANLLLLTLPELAACDAVILDGPSTIRVIGAAGPAVVGLAGQPTDFVSLLPLSPIVRGVTTDGLLYPLADATLLQGPARGLSNELTGHTATVSTRDGRLAVVHTRRGNS